MRVAFRHGQGMAPLPMGRNLHVAGVGRRGAVDGFRGTVVGCGGTPRRAGGGDGVALRTPTDFFVSQLSLDHLMAAAAGQHTRL